MHRAIVRLLPVVVLLGGCAKPVSPALEEGVGSPASSGPRPSASAGMCTSIDVAARELELRSGKASSTVAAENSGDWIYRSRPIAIDGDGEYTLMFGPLAAEFDYPRKPSSLSFGWPPDFWGTVAPGSGSIAVVNDQGGRWLRVPLRVSGEVPPCKDLTAFIL